MSHRAILQQWPSIKDNDQSEQRESGWIWHLLEFRQEGCINSLADAVDERHRIAPLDAHRQHGPDGCDADTSSHQ